MYFPRIIGRLHDFLRGYPTKENPNGLVSPEIIQKLPQITADLLQLFGVYNSRHGGTDTAWATAITTDNDSLRIFSELRNEGLKMPVLEELVRIAEREKIKK